MHKNKLLCERLHIYVLKTTFIRVESGKVQVMNIHTFKSYTLLILTSVKMNLDPFIWVLYKNMLAIRCHIIAPGRLHS